MPCCQSCRVSQNSFLNISKNDFNQFNQVVNYFDRNQIRAHAKSHAEIKLTLFLAGALGLCPRVMDKKVIETISAT